MEHNVARVTITKRFSFSAAHRIPGHPKCGRMHGHNYDVDIKVVRTFDTHMDPRGFVIDFGDLKEIGNRVFVDWMDHRYLRGTQEPMPVNDIPDEQIYSLDTPWSTAEWLALSIGLQMADALPAGVGLVSVTVWETPTSCATYERGVNHAD